LERGHYWKEIEFPANADSFARYEKNLSPELAEELIIWRLVTDKIASLHELENDWSFDDLLRAESYLSMQSDIMRLETNRSKK